MIHFTLKKGTLQHNPPVAHRQPPAPAAPGPSLLELTGVPCPGESEQRASFPPPVQEKAQFFPTVGLLHIHTEHFPADMSGPQMCEFPTPSSSVCPRPGVLPFKLGCDTIYLDRTSDPTG